MERSLHPTIRRTRRHAHRSRTSLHGPLIGLIILASLALDAGPLAGAPGTISSDDAASSHPFAVATIGRRPPAVAGRSALDAPVRGWVILAPDQRAAPDAGCVAPTATTTGVTGAAASAASSAVPGSAPRAGSRTDSRIDSAGGAGTRPIAAFLGDSYTSGYNGAGYGGSGWPAIVSAALGLRSLNRAVPGTGFVNPGWTGQPIRTQVAAVIRANPRIVFLAGGHNDRRYATATTRAAAIAVIDRLHRALPHATLIVIGPIWSGDVAPPSLVSLRDALRREAKAIGAPFIDPIGGRWLAGSAKRFIGPDGLHPTNAGHRHIAVLVVQALRGRPRVQATPRQTSDVARPLVASSASSGPRREIALFPCAS